jgi:hypothetical protein
MFVKYSQLTKDSMENMRDLVIWSRAATVYVLHILTKSLGKVLKRYPIKETGSNVQSVNCMLNLVARESLCVPAVIIF